MKQQMKGLIYFFLVNSRYSFTIFWSILLGITLFTAITAYIIDDQEGVMKISLTAPMYVYSGIYGFFVVKNWIPFFIKLGTSRKNILLGLGLFFMGVSFSFALTGTVLQSVFMFFAKQINLHMFSFGHISLFIEDTWYIRLLIDSSLMLFCFTFMFVIGLLFYKYGLAIGGAVLGIFMMGIIYSIYKGWIIEFAINVFTNLELTLFWQIALIATLLYIFSWFFIRKITIVHAR